MRIKAFIWPDERKDHIARHGVTPEEVEQVCFGRSFVQRAKSEGESPVYYILGQSKSGRYLFCVVILFPDGKGFPCDRAGYDRQRETALPKMDRAMKKAELPKTDSIRELADFWDSHDVTDFEEALEEVTEPIFKRGVTVNVPLESHQVQAVEQMAHAKGVSREDLIRAWVLQKLARRNNAR